MRTFTFFLAALATAVAVPAAAQDAAASNAGQQLATSGAGNGVAACASCHGASGEGQAASGFPRIAGQSQSYLAHQLASFANGSRSNPVMTPIAKALTPQQINAVAAYYAALATPPTAPTAAPSPQLQKRGQTLASVGDNSIGVQSCANCHGPGGSGEPPTYPYLAGQNSTYLRAALSAWKTGTRRTDPSMQMPIIAKRLSDNDIAALAAFYAAQPAPPAAAQRSSTPAGNRAQPAPSISGQSAPTQGIGTEQGATSSGGSQGPGGGGAASGAGPSGNKKGNTR